MNAATSKNIGPRKFVRNLPQRIDLKSSNKQLAFKKSSIYYRLKNIKKEYKNTKLKIILSTYNVNLIYLMVLMKFQIFKIISYISQVYKYMKHYQYIFLFILCRWDE